ncbi:MAG: adenosylcobalamin-dependent ribonucleoside-diphosphate reductase [Candidatus Nezhaarchaeota archaeon]|nr:adenosylcobalamin-dependent ribonucleoside-diphosphate reductase [Candidatus Nezhaarchaeota archaeon]
MVSQVRKRDGRLEEFNPLKISSAILKAFNATGEGSAEEAERLAKQVVEAVEAKFGEEVPGVEDIQDIVEEVLIKAGYARTAKAYILYRQKRAEVRGVKEVYGVRDDLKLSVNAVRVLERRYLLKDERGRVVETTSQLFWRVARSIAAVDELYGASRDEVARSEVEFYRMMASLEFLPNSPTLMNAGTNIGQLSACFVIPVEDSIEGIFNALKLMAIVHKSGGGTGFSFSRLRPKGDVVASTMGVASGPVSFMRIFDVATEVIKQGGKRRGANMGVLRVDHPDILDFINAKAAPGLFNNFNLSVAVTDRFMEAVKEGGDYPLINPRTGEVVRRLPARDVFDLMVSNAWRTGDPGLLFIDEINRHNPTPKLGYIEATNPCGEVPLLPYESCNLGSLNLSKVVKRGEVDWNRLGGLVEKAVHFLDNVIDANRYPAPEIERMTKLNRKVGLGVMGFAEMLIQLGVPYDSSEALRVGEEVMKFISERAREASVNLGRLRGSFPSFEDSVWAGRFDALRNATLTSIAPTGTISIIANTSSSIEPLFALVYVRQVLEDVRLIEANPLFEKVARERGFYSQSLMLKVAKQGSLRGVGEVPEDVRRLFVTALEVDPEWHVRVQAAFQKYVDNAVAKTVNLRPEASMEDVRRVFTLAYELKCKGVTVYRYGSKPAQVLYVGVGVEAEAPTLSCPSTVCAF